LRIEKLTLTEKILLIPGSFPLARVWPVVLSEKEAGVAQALLPPADGAAVVVPVQETVTADAGMTLQLVSPDKDVLAALAESVQVFAVTPLMLKLTVTAWLPATLVTLSGLPEAVNVIFPDGESVGPVVVVAAAVVVMVAVGVIEPGRRGF
jgi:hypothetical protein